MSNLNQFLNGVANRSPASIVNAFSSGGWGATSGISNASLPDGKLILSGALTGGALATIVTVTGAGILEGLVFVPASNGGATVRTGRVQLTIDGVIVFDSTSASMSSALSALVVGSMGSNGYVTSANVPFNVSLVVKIASSITETDQQQIRIKYYTV